MVRLILVCLLLAHSALGQTPLRKTEATAFAQKRGSAVLLDLASNKILFAHNLRDAAQSATVTGSTLKPLLLLSLLQQGRVDPNARVACVRSQRINGELVRCAHPEDVRDVDAKEAIVWSCNTYFVRATEKFQTGEIERVLASYGLTSPTGLAATEAQGSIQPARDVGSRELLALGLEGIRTTPIEMAEAYRRLATQLQENSAAAKVVREAVAGTVDRGMALPAKSAKVAIAGKTGTAVNGNTSVGWFAGFAPADAPRVAVVVRLRGVHGADAAAIAKQLLEAWSAEQH
jgi:penicillin-binding protein 2